MNITKEQAKKHLSNLIDNLLDSEETHYSEHFNIDYEQVDLTATEDLQEHNYKDLRVLQDYLNQDNNIDKVIEESKNLFTNEQENEVMNQDEPDVSFDVGFYRGLLEAKNYLNQDDYEDKAKREEITQSILWEYISKNDIEEIQERLSNV
jgi:ribosomal protein S18